MDDGNDEGERRGAVQEREEELADGGEDVVDDVERDGKECEEEVFEHRHDGSDARDVVVKECGPRNLS